MGFNDNQNRIITNNIVDELKLNPITDQVPKYVNPSIQPVFVANRKNATILGATARTTTGTSTLLTTSSVLDTYITGVNVSYTKDVACDVASGRLGITGVILGATTHLLSVAVLTLTAQNDTTSIEFNPPIKVDRNSAIALGITFTAGTACIAGNVSGYTEETGVITT